MTDLTILIAVIALALWPLTFYFFVSATNGKSAEIILTA